MEQGVVLAVVVLPISDLSSQSTFLGLLELEPKKIAGAGLSRSILAPVAFHQVREQIFPNLGETSCSKPALEWEGKDRTGASVSQQRMPLRLLLQLLQSCHLLSKNVAPNEPSQMWLRHVQIFHSIVLKVNRSIRNTLYRELPGDC